MAAGGEDKDGFVIADGRGGGTGDDKGGGETASLPLAFSLATLRAQLVSALVGQVFLSSPLAEEKEVGKR